MELLRQEYWSGLPFPSPGDLPNPGIEPASPALQADSSSSEPPGEPFISEVKKLGGTPLLQSPRSHCQLGGHGRHRRSLFPLAVMLFRALENNCISGLPWLLCTHGQYNHDPRGNALSTEASSVLQRCSMLYRLCKHSACYARPDTSDKPSTNHKQQFWIWHNP